MNSAAALTFVVVLSLGHAVLGGCPYHAIHGSSAAPAGGVEGWIQKSKQASQSSSNLGGWEGDVPGANNVSDPLVRLNDLFHSGHAAANQALLPMHIIVTEGDFLVMLTNEGGTQYSRRVLPANTMKYHNLKMVCHLSLAVYTYVIPEMSLTNTSKQVTLSTTTMASLRSYYNELLGAKNSILGSGRFSPGAEQQRQELMYASVVDFTESLITKGGISTNELFGWLHSQWPQYQLNVDTASEVEVQALHAAFETFRASLTPQQFDAMKIIVTASHMARPRNLASQYFARYYGVDNYQSDRFVTLEAIGDEPTALDNLATHFTDYIMGEAVMQDQYDMHQDVRCAGAKKALDVIFPESANSTWGCYPTGTGPDSGIHPK